MYRYQSRNRFNQVTKPNRLRPFLIIVVLALIVFMVMRLAGTGGLNEANFENQRNARIRSEMQLALARTNSLSRLGAKSDSGELGRIRQYVHGIEVMNELNIGMYGELGRLYQQSVFDNIYAILDDFDAKLSSGQKVNDAQAKLTEAMAQLNDFTTEALFGN